jgi:cytochrome d ubiquinol oxidase subunit I
VTGLTSVPASDRPTTVEATIAHWAFDTMVGIGSLFVLLALWYALVWLRHRRLPASAWFYRGAAVAGVLSGVAVECGWITTEVGRQPWIVYQNMRVAQAVTSTRAAGVWAMFGVVVLVYVFVFASFLVVLLRMRARWRLADEAGGPAGPVGEEETAETDTPYGPRSTVAASDAPRRSGDGTAWGDRP